MPSATTAATTATDDQKKAPVLRWCTVADVLSRSSSATAARSSGRVSGPPAAAAPFIDGGTAWPRARSAVGATSISWAKGARPVLAELSQAGVGEPRTGDHPHVQLRAAVVDLGDPGQHQQRVARRASRPRRAAGPRPRRSRSAPPPAASGSVPSSVLRGPGSPASVSSSSETSASGQPASRPPGSAASDGRLSARVISTPGAADGEGRGPSRHRGAADRGPQRAGLGAEPGGALVGGGALDDGGGIGERDRGRPLLEAAVGQRGVQRRLGCALGVGRGAGVGAAGSPGRGTVGSGHRRQTLVGPGHAGAVAGAEGRPAVQQAGRRAGGAHRHRADRGLPGQVPQLRAWPPDRRRPRSARGRRRRAPGRPWRPPAPPSAAPATGSGPREEHRHRGEQRGRPAGRPAVIGGGPRAARGRGPPAAGPCRPRRATSPPGAGRPRPAGRRVPGR